ncbi:MAG: hypothetical protein M3454_14450 [Actinomycetota bacterium]|nr:hypothetical protein [Actinomycetota bacterium]
MDIVFTVVLLVLFLVTFVPAVQHARRGMEPLDGEVFTGRMRPLARADAGGRWVLMPQSPELVRRARQRRALQFRKRLLLGLAAVVLISAIAAMWFGPVAWAGQAVADLLLGGYVLYLVRSRKTRDQEFAVVRSLPTARGGSQTVSETASSLR